MPCASEDYPMQMQIFGVNFGFRNPLKRLVPAILQPFQHKPVSRRVHEISGAVYLGDETESELFEITERPYIQAAARYWRDRLKDAACTPEAGNMDITLHIKLSEVELERFEVVLRYVLAKSLYFVKSNPLFLPRGLDITVQLWDAAEGAGVKEKISFFGWMTRMRILPESVDHEIGDWTEYKRGRWRNIWTPVADAQ